MTAGYRLFLGLPFNLWAIVYLYLTSDNLPYEKIGDNEPVSIADEIPFDICTVDGVHPNGLGMYCMFKGFESVIKNLNL